MREGDGGGERRGRERKLSSWGEGQLQDGAEQEDNRPI